jgi:hypothetical protein
MFTPGSGGLPAEPVGAPLSFGQGNYPGGGAAFDQSSYPADPAGAPLSFGQGNYPGGVPAFDQSSYPVGTPTYDPNAFQGAPATGP